MFYEEWAVPILIVVFLSGLLVGVNIGIICGNKCGFHGNDVEIPRYVLRPENFPMRYQNPNQMGQVNQFGKRRFNY